MPSTSGQQNFSSGEKKESNKTIQVKKCTKKTFSAWTALSGLILVHSREGAIKVGTTVETDAQIQVCTSASTELDPIFGSYILGLCFPPPVKCLCLALFHFNRFLNCLDIN